MSNPAARDILEQLIQLSRAKQMTDLFVSNSRDDMKA